MTNEEKRKLIDPWIDPAERVTVHFLDARNLIAEVTGTNDQLVDLSIETNVPHMRQTVSVPLSHTEVSEDLGHYTRDPDHPLKRRRLMLVVDQNRPVVIY